MDNTSPKKTPFIVQNAIRCRKCGDAIESRHTAMMDSCSCGAVAVFGGFEYLGRSGDAGTWDELSIIDEK